jgi:hypothetical protein
MSSISRSFNQRLTNKLVTVPTGMPMLYSAAELANAAIVGNAQVLGSLVLVPTVSDLSGYIGALTGICIDSREILLDLGATVTLGIQGGESSLIVFRLVQRTNTTIANKGRGATGYVVVDNNISRDPGTDTEPENPLPVNVSRVS